MVRRSFLKIVASTLLIGNIAFFAWRVHEATIPNAAITYAGLDSLFLVAPRSQPAAILLRGKWHPDPASDGRVRVPIMTTRFGPPKQVVVISLGAKPSYGSFIQSLRSLRVRHICHVAILEGAGIASEMERGDTPVGLLEIPTIALCEGSIGDAVAFDGKLPPDALLRL
jgi:hypothetical protein